MHQALNSRPPKASGLVLKKKDGGGGSDYGTPWEKDGDKNVLIRTAVGTGAD